MKEHPILMSTPMVQAILDGRKTQTRRVIKLPDGYELQGTAKEITENILNFGTESLFYNGEETSKELKPRYQGGDILWVRETWKCVQYDSMDGNLGYEVEFRDGERKYFEFDDNERFHQFGKFAFKEGWQSSLFMPREAARIFLRVTSVRVERVQDISEADAKAEGIKSYWDEPHRDVAPFIGAAKELGADLCHTRREAFEQLWDSINKKRGYGWDVNPWVWVYEFERVEGMKC